MYAFYKIMCIISIWKYVYIMCKWASYFDRIKSEETEFVLTFCNVDVGVIDQLKIAKVLSYVGTKFVCQGGKLSGFHLASRIWFQISLASLLIEKQSALIAIIGWLKTHYPSFRIIDPVSNIHRPRSPKTFLQLEERVFGSVGNTIASDMLDQTARYNSAQNLLK